MIISQTPLRVSLLGGGTDLPEWYENELGCVVGSTIDKYIYVIVTKRFDNKICIGYSKQETVDSIDEIQHDLVRETARMAGMTKGFEVKTFAEIPSGGSGLGSSSAILVGLLKAFYEYQKVFRNNMQIAYDAFTIERNVLGRPVGKQDHYFAAVGGKNVFEFNGDSVVRFPTTISENNLHIFYTGITRNSSDILSRQQSNINEYTEFYYKELASMARNYSIHPDTLSVSLKLNWEYKKKLSDNISNPEIEKMCVLADQGGATAYKILGAGGGGFLLIYCENDKLNLLRTTLKDYRELPFRFVDHGVRIVFNNE